MTSEQATLAITDASTLGEAKRFVADSALRGTQCQCCGRVVKVRRRYLNAPMLIVLVILENVVRGGSENYVHVPSVIADTPWLSAEVRASVRGDWAKMVHFGLIEKHAKRRAGYWRISHMGREFVAGRTRILKCVHMFDKKAVVVADALSETVSLEDVLHEAGWDLGAMLVPRSPS